MEFHVLDSKDTSKGLSSPLDNQRSDGEASEAGIDEKNDEK